MSNHRVMFVVEYEDGRTTEFSIDRWTLSLGDYAAKIIAYERQEKGPTSLVLIALIQKRFVLLRISDPLMGKRPKLGDVGKKGVHDDCCLRRSLVSTSLNANGNART